MIIEQIKERLARIRIGAPGVAGLPRSVLEIQPGFVAGTSLDGTVRSPRRLRRMGIADLESGSLQAQLNRPNITAQTELHRALRAVTDVIGNGSNGLGLLIPDGTVRVATLSFETLPDNRKEAEALVCWRLRETFPFPPEEARASIQVLRREPDCVELLAVAAKSSVLAEYEAALEPIDASATLILPAGLALLPLLPEGDAAGQVLVHLCCGWMTAVVVFGRGVRLWRVRQVGGEDHAGLAGEVAREVARVLATAADHWKVEIGRIWLCARPPMSPDFGPEISRRISREVQLLSPGNELASTLPPDDRENFGRFGAAVAGLIANAG